MLWFSGEHSCFIHGRLDILTEEVFLVFLSPSGQMLGQYFKHVMTVIFLHPSQFIACSQHSTQCPMNMKLREHRLVT